MWINGCWYTESEVKSLLDSKDKRIAELEDKHWSECRQIAHYDDEMRDKPQRDHWISVKDKLPTENTLVLCYCHSLTGEGNRFQNRRRCDMTRLQEVEQLIDNNLALVTEYSKRAAELMGSIRTLEKERDKLVKKNRGVERHCSLPKLNRIFIAAPASLLRTVIPHDL